MDIKDLDKRQLILLTLLITFIVSIATGIVTVSLMNQAPKAVPQTINNVIQRTIEKVTTVTAPDPIKNNPNNNTDKTDESTKDDSFSLVEDSVLLNIYPKDFIYISTSDDFDDDGSGGENKDTADSLGQGVIVSDVGLILVDSSILIRGESNYIVILGDIDFNANLIKKFDNGFSILKISEKINNNDDNSSPLKDSDNSSIDNI